MRVKNISYENDSDECVVLIDNVVVDEGPIAFERARFYCYDVKDFYFDDKEQRYFLNLVSPEVYWHKKEDMELISFQDLSYERDGSYGFISYSVGYSFSLMDVYVEIEVVETEKGYLLEVFSSKEGMSGRGYKNCVVPVPNYVVQNALSKAEEYVMDMGRDKDFLM